MRFTAFYEQLFGVIYTENTYIVLIMQEAMLIRLRKILGY